MTKAKQPTTYTVEFTIIVDYPEKRCETLPSEYVSRVRVIAKTATASPRVVRGWKLRGRLDKTTASV